MSELSSNSDRGWNQPMGQSTAAKLPMRPLREGVHWQVDVETGCWNWLGYTVHGYGTTRFGQAHRVVWRQMGRETLPDWRHWDLHHGCENPLCVNPDHMEIKPKAEHVREHKRETVELSDEQRAAIRRAGLDHTLTQWDIAEQFGIPRPTVNKILNGYSWTDGLRILPVRPCRSCSLEFVGDNRRTRYCLNCRPRKAAA